MADKYTPEEIQEIFERYDDAIKTTGRASDELKREFADATKGLRGYSNELGNLVRKSGGQFADYGKSLYKGKQGLDGMSGAIDGVATAIQTLLIALGPVGWVTKAAVLAVGAFAKGINAVNKQGDELYKAFQDLSRAGSIGAGGVTQVFQNMQQFGYNLEELGKMAELLRANSETLSQFGTTATDGAKKFAGVADTIQNGGLRQSLFNLGMGVDDINKGIAGYITQQTRLGTAQTRTQAQLTEGASAYLFELEALTRLTGKDKERLQSERAEAMRNNMFYAKLREAQRKDEADGGNRAEDMQTALSMANRYGPGAQKAFMDQITGFVSKDKDAQAFNRGVGGEFTVAMSRAASGAIKYTDAIQAAGEGALRRQGANEQSALIPGSEKFIGTLQDLTMLAEDSRKGIDKSIAEAKGEVAKDADNTTARMSKIRDDQIKTTRSLQDFVQLGVSPATAALEVLAGAAEGAASNLPGSNKGGIFDFFNKSKQTTDRQRTEELGPLLTAINGEAKAKAEAYYGKAITDKEYTALIKATHAEAAAGKNASQKEQAMVMASILNRAREKDTGIMGALYAKNQFQAVTGTSRNGGRASPEFIAGPGDQRLKSIEGSALLLDQVSKNQRNFSAADPRAYGPGTNIGWRNGIMANGGTVEGGSVFNTAFPNTPAGPSTTASVPTNKGYQFGGVASGPLNGYQATLHGSEAIVPLADGKSIPVEIPGYSSGMQDQTGLMTAQLSKLDELIGVMNKQNSISSKILQRSS